MNIEKKIILLIVLSMFTVLSVSASYQLILQSGHEGMPVDIKWHEKSRTIISAGEDGRLIVTRPEDNKILHRFRVSEDKIYNIEIDPSNKKVSIVTSKDGIYTISVWDWSEEKQLFTYELASEPLFTSWSARGRYLTVGNLGNPSVLVLEGRTGRRLSYLQRLPSLYNAGYIGSTETILMTYAVTGAIRYWDIRSSALKLSTETLPNLQGIKVLQTDSKTTLFAYRDNTLYLINRQTGAVLDQLVIPGIIDVSIDELNGEIDALVVNLAGTTLHEYMIRNDRFLPRDFGGNNLETTAIPLHIDTAVKPVRVLRKNGTSYLMSRTGSLFADGLTGFSPIIDDQLWHPGSMAFSGDHFYLNSGNMILRFSSPFFNETSKGDTNLLNDIIREKIHTESGSSETGMIVLSDNIILQWDKNGTGNSYGIRRFQFNSPENEILFSNVSPLQKLDEIDDGRILTVDRSGTVSIMNSLTGEVESSYSALGILDSAYSSEGDFFLAGRSSRGRAGTALEQIDVQTRESIPVPDQRFMIYSVEAGSESIYTLGVEKDSSGKSKTSLLRHNINKPEQGRTILRIEGEDLDAFILPEASGNGIFTSLGGIVRRINGSRQTEYQWNESVNYLAVRGDVLYGLDRDGALILWNVRNGHSLIKVYFFNDGSWIAIPPDGDKVWASPGAMNNVMIYRNGRVIDPERISQIMDDSNPFS